MRVMIKNTYYWQQGQAGLVVLLVMMVLMTLGVSVSSQSVSELFSARKGEDANRAFDAAEAGVEEALGSISSFMAGPESTKKIQTPADQNNPIELTYQIDKIYELEARLEVGQDASVVVSNSLPSKSLVIDFAKDQTCGSAASIVVNVLSRVAFGGNVGDTSVRRYGYRAPGAPCDRADNFTAASVGENGYLAKVVISLGADDVLVRIKPEYQASVIHVYAGSGWKLPVQQYKVSSVAHNTSGGETRAISVQRSIAAVPSIFDYVLFSGTVIIK